MTHKRYVMFYNGGRDQHKANCDFSNNGVAFPKCPQMRRGDRSQALCAVFDFVKGAVCLQLVKALLV